MSKALFFNIPATGHINPTTPVIADLVQRGEQVVCVNTEPIRAKMESTGAAFIPYPAAESAHLDRLMRQAGEGDLMRNALELVRLSAALLPFVRALIEREQPDYLLFDSLASWAKLGAKQAGLPGIALIATFAISPQAMPPITGAMMLETIRGLIGILPAYLRTAWQMRQQQGLLPESPINALASYGNLNLVFTSRELQPAADTFGERFRFVGTPSTPRPEDGDFPFEQLNGQPLTYISLGTLSQNPDFYRVCFDAFGDQPGQYVLSVGRQTDLTQIGPIPDNFIVRSYVPQLDLLPRVEVFVTHGGLNSVHESLRFGVPLVVVPQQPEQALVAQQVAVHGAGIATTIKPPFGQIKADSLREAAQQVRATPRYRQQAQALGLTLEAAGNATGAADLILGWLGAQAGSVTS